MFAVVGLTIGLVVLGGSVLGGVALARNHSNTQDQVPVGNNAPANADDSPGTDDNGQDRDDDNAQGSHDDADDQADDHGDDAMTPTPSASPTEHETEGPDDDD